MVAPITYTKRSAMPPMNNMLANYVQSYKSHLFELYKDDLVIMAMSLLSRPNNENNTLSLLLNQFLAFDRLHKRSLQIERKLTEMQVVLTDTQARVHQAEKERQEALARAVHAESKLRQRRRIQRGGSNNTRKKRKKRKKHKRRKKKTHKK